MSLSPLFPHYGPLGSGPYYVSLAIPGLTSEISKSLGFNTPTGVLLPNIDYITKFSEGELGISDSFIRDMLFKNMNNPISSNNEEIFRQFAKQNKIDISDINKFKKGNKFIIPKDQIKIPEENNMTGFKAFEKTLLQSIFETQKPYMEIVKTSSQTIAKAEDIIARVMPFFGNPLTTKSKVPKKNKGGGGGPKAIGYQNAKELIKELNGLSKLIEKGVKKNIDSLSTNSIQSNLTNSNNTSGYASKYWKVISTAYSTGIYNPNLEYDYSYVNLPADDDLPIVSEDLIDFSNGDPYEPFKPKCLIFGIYNSKGEAVNPNDYLKTTGIIGNNKIEVETPFKIADWLLKSPKWKITDGYEWPTFSEPIYTWINPFGATKISSKKPNGYSIKRYGSNEKDILTGSNAIKGNPIINGFNKIEEESYRKHFGDIIDITLNSDNSITKEVKKQVNVDIMNKIELSSQLQISYMYSHTKSSVYNKVNNKLAFPELMRKSYKPYEIYSEAAANDKELSSIVKSKGKKPGMIWVDPDADYDMKVIRIDPSSNVEYIDPQSGQEVKTNTIRFVKNRVRFEMSNSGTFSFSISKNGSTPEVLDNLKEFTLENWNFDNNKISNLNSFTINMWTKDAPKKFSDKGHYSFRVDRPKLTINNFLSQLGLTQSTPLLNQQFSVIPTYDTYSITKKDNNWYFTSTANNYIKNGINKLDDIFIYTENGIVKRWYQIYDTKMKNTGLGFNLPSFGIERIIRYDYDKNTYDIKDKSIPLYSLTIDKKYSSSKIIDPTQIINNKLTISDPFVNYPLWYGHGSETEPQTLGIIKRNILTDLDTESYYIVEGVLRKDNESEDESGNRVKSGSGGKSWYKIGDAIGASRVFVGLLSSILTKLIPKIIKLLKLFQNPFDFIIDILFDKLSNNVDFLTKESTSTFSDAVKLRDKIKSQVGGMDNIKKQIDTIRLIAKNKSDFLVAQADVTNSYELDEIKNTAKKIQREAEIKASKLEKTLNKKKELVNKLKDKFKKSTLSNYIHVDDDLNFIFPPGGAAVIPFSLFGKDLSFGASLELNNIPKPSVKLIFPSNLSSSLFKNVQFLVNKENKLLTPVIKPTISDIVKDEINSIRTNVKDVKNTKYKLNNDNSVQVKFEDGTTKNIPSESLTDFINSNNNKYDFIYVTEYIDGILKEVDLLIENGDSDSLSIAKEKLDFIKNKSLINSKSNKAIDSKIKELNDINSRLTKNTQPLLKTLLGFITFPIKIIADIIKWLMDFFMSLTNPMKLASKMKEFLSFKWILQFFKPDDILSIFGLKFQPLVLIPYAASAAISKGKYGGDLSGMADMSKYINLGFIPTLPNYSSDQYKNFLKDLQPFRLLTIFKMMEKFINSVINFIWSLFGIEAIIKSPNIDMSPMYNSNTTINKQNNLDINDLNTSDINSNINVSSSSNNLDSKFIYDVQLPDGKLKSFKSLDELNIFIQDNKDINFNFTF